MIADLGWVDIALLAVMAVSVLVGLWRGFVFEIVSLLGWLVAFVLANTCVPFVSELLPWGQGSGAAHFWAAWVLIFVLVLIACSLLARLMRALISATPLSFVDRILGGAFGVVRGAFILVVVGMMVSLSPFAHAPSWQQSHASLWLGQALGGLKPVLPQSITTRIET